MTISSSVRELSRLSNPTATVVADTAASSFLRGARGNSGVILSLLFRGISKGLKGQTEVGGKVFAEALSLGVTAAYKAVMKPTEGTILTVARVAAETAKKVTSDDFIETFEAALNGAKEALAQTPEMLPVLKKAGVVDAGGRGLLIIMNGFLKIVSGDESELKLQADSDRIQLHPAGRSDFWRVRPEREDPDGRPAGPSCQLRRI